jgi:uncharacterized protein YjcR
MVKKEAHEKALAMYLKAGGKIKNVDLGKAVGVNPITIGQWIKKDNWKAKLEEVKAAPAPAVKKRKPRESIILKKDAFHKAVRIFQESGSSISNAELGKKVKVSPQTIANWKKMPEWGQVAPVTARAVPIKEVQIPQEVQISQEASRIEAAPVAQETPKPEMPKANVAAVIASQDLIALNERLRSMLDREYLTAADLEHLSNAKLSLLEAADVYLGIIQDAEDMMKE